MTTEYYDVALWSTIEINVGIVGVSLPTLRLILVRISPRVFGSQESILNQSRPSLPCSDLVARRQMRLSSVAAVLGIEEEDEDEDEEQEEEERYERQEEASP